MERGKSSEEVSKLNQLCLTNPIIVSISVCTHNVQKMPQWIKDQTSRHPSDKTSLYCKGKAGEEGPGNEASLYCKGKAGEEGPGNEASLYCKGKAGEEGPGNGASLYCKQEKLLWGVGLGMRLHLSSLQGC